MDGERTMTRADVFVSVVALIDEGVLDLEDRILELSTAVASRYRDYEIILLDDRLPNDVVADLRRLLTDVPCLRVLRLARRSSADTVVLAGLEAAIGDFVAVTAIAYDPAEAVIAVLEELRTGRDVVQGEHTGPLGGGPLTRLGRRGFYWYNRRFLEVDIPSRSTYLLGLTRSAVNGIAATARTHRYVRHLIRHIGYRVHAHPYTMRNPQLRRARSRPKWVDAVEMVSSYSTHPLRVVTLLGLLAGMLSLLYGIYVVITALTSRHIAAGWTTMSLELAAMFFVTMLVLAVQAEYIGRILAESRREPGYHIAEEIESDSSIAEADRRNVVAV